MVVTLDWHSLRQRPLNSSVRRQSWPQSSVKSESLLFRPAKLPSGCARSGLVWSFRLRNGRSLRCVYEPLAFYPAPRICFLPSPAISRGVITVSPGSLFQSNTPCAFSKQPPLTPQLGGAQMHHICANHGAASYSRRRFVSLSPNYSFKRTAAGWLR